MYDLEKEECIYSIRISGSIVSANNEIIDQFVKCKGMEALEINLNQKSE